MVPLTVEVARVAISFAIEEGVAGGFVGGHRVITFEEGVEFRSEWADREAVLKGAQWTAPSDRNR